MDIRKYQSVPTAGLVFSITMSRRQSEIYKQKSRLEYQGWELKGTENCIRPNSGSEKLSHLLAKSTAAKVAIDAGYRVQSEVVTKNGDECDILAFGLEGRKPIVIEVENDCTDETVQKKQEQYKTPDIREVFVISLDEAPADPDELYEYIQEQTGLV